MDIVDYIEREYICKNCGKFIVIHRNLISRNKICCYCGIIVKETGNTLTIEGDFCIVRKNEKEINRFLKK